MHVHFKGVLEVIYCNKCLNVFMYRQSLQSMDSITVAIKIGGTVREDK